MRILYGILLLLLTSFTQAQINACGQGQAIHLVILGSSTAAGTGPSSSDSTWVNRYRKYLQSVNPSNQITNLARGGYNTYRIQADNYVAPVGRPAIDSSRNISRAISLNPDGIIVNMPSNDAAIGIGVNEQMANFIRLKAVADSFNIPIWICTTQPRNFSTPQRTVQTLTRDSILSYFGTKAIDFWSGLANSSDGIDSLFDSGDGVHLNDTAHGILAQRVIGKFIPNVLSSPLPYTDFAIFTSRFNSLDACGDSSQTIEVSYGNLGIAATSAQQITIVSNNLITNHSDTVRINSTKVHGPCELELLQTNVNLSSAGSYEVEVFLQSLDTISQNDSLLLKPVKIIGKPSSLDLIDTVCISDTTWLSPAKTRTTDQVVWYEDSLQTRLLQVQDSLSVVLSQDSTFYYQIVRGPLHFSAKLETGQTTTTNWNGIMFNIIAQDHIVVDSFNTRFFDAGPQAVRAYFRAGSYRGFENNAAAWAFWGTDSIQVLNSGDFQNLTYMPIPLVPGDTLAVYLHLANSASRLSYRASATSQTVTDGKVKVNSGSGISHTFGSIFSPRNFVGKIHYHFGTNLMGDCASPLASYTLGTYSNSFDLGPDSTLFSNQSITYSVPASFTNVRWFNGDTTYNLLLDQNNLNQGQNLIWVNATDSNGCHFIDSLILTFNTSVGIEENNYEQKVRLFPNPATNLVQIQSVEKVMEWRILNSQGQLLKEKGVYPESSINIQDLAEGMYWIQVRLARGGQDQLKLLILR